VGGADGGGDDASIDGGAGSGQGGSGQGGSGQGGSGPGGAGPAGAAGTGGSGGEPDGSADRIGNTDTTTVDTASDADPGDDGETDGGVCQDDRLPPDSPDAAGCAHPSTRCKPQGGPASCATGVCVYEMCNHANQGKACKMSDGSTGTCCGATCGKIDFTTDAKNCGGCGQICPSGNCTNSACADDCRPGCMTNGVSCGAGKVCMRPQNDANAGACMTASCAGLADGAPCAHGVGGICCGGACVDPKRDAQHCSGCGIRCCAGTVCKGAICGSAPAEPVLVAVNPIGATAAVGDFVEMWALRIDPIVGSSDATDEAQWSSDNPDVATVGASVNARAIVTAIAPGTAHITAQVRGHSSTATITVSAATLQSIVVAPSNASFPVGFLRLRALGQYSDGTTQDITELVDWSAGDGGVSGVGGGEAHLETPGQALVTVSLCTRSATVQGSTNVTVTPLTVSSVAVSATKTSIKRGERTTLSAVATYSDGSSGDFTAACESWWPDNPDVAIPAYQGAAPNDVVGIAPGTTTIECVRDNGVRGMTTITVTP